MQRFTIFTVFFIFATLVQATTYTTISNGNWDEPSTWDVNQVPDITSSNGVQVVINHDVTVGTHLQFHYGSGLTVKTGANLDIDGKFEIKHNATGTFLIESGATASAREIKFKSGTASFTNLGQISVEKMMRVHGDAQIRMDGNGTISTDELDMAENGSIIGINDGGMVYFDKVSMAQSSYVQCVDGGCNYDAYNIPQSPVDLLGSASLPVEWMYFEAKTNERGVLLQWATATEQDNEYFSVEASIDGKNWEVLAEINGAGTTQHMTTYSFEDARNLTARVCYYRIAQHDFDGTVSYSEIAAVMAETEMNSRASKLTVFPNPVRDHFTVQIEQNDVEEAQQVFLFNAIGQQLEIPTNTTSNRLDLQLPAGTQPGHYVLVVKTKTQTHSAPVIVVK